MAAVLRALAVRMHDHRHRVPANIGLDPTLDRTITRIIWLLTGGDRIQVSGIRAIGKIGAGPARVVDDSFDQEMRPFGSVRFEYRLDRLDPFTGFQRVLVLKFLALGHR